MKSLKTCSLLLLVAPFLFMCPSVSAASIKQAKETSRRSYGCMNYGHSCLGGHGKRSSNPLPTDQRSFLQYPLLINRIYPMQNTHQEPRPSHHYTKQDPIRSDASVRRLRLHNGDRTTGSRYIPEYEAPLGYLNQILGKKSILRDNQMNKASSDEEVDNTDYNLDDYVYDLQSRRNLAKSVTIDGDKDTNNDWELEQENRSKGSVINPRPYNQGWIRR